MIWVNELVDKNLLMPIHEGGMYNLSHQDVEADMAMSLSQMSGASDAMGYSNQTKVFIELHNFLSDPTRRPPFIWDERSCTVQISITNELL